MPTSNAGLAKSNKKMALVKSHSVEETSAIGKNLALTIPEKSVVAFFGELGAGKTTLIKSFVEERIGISKEAVSSPTFQILHIYEGAENTLYHFDLWRLADSEEFIALGFDEYLTGHDVCIEWSEKIESILPKNCYRILITGPSEYEREIRITH